MVHDRKINNYNNILKEHWGLGVENDTYKTVDSDFFTCLPVEIYTALDSREPPNVH